MSQNLTKRDIISFDLTNDSRINRSRLVAWRFLLFLLMGDRYRDGDSILINPLKVKVVSYDIDSVAEDLEISRRHTYRVFQRLKDAELAKKTYSRCGCVGRPKTLFTITQKGRRKIWKATKSIAESCRKQLKTQRHELGITQSASAKTPDLFGFPEFKKKWLPIIFNKKVLWCPQELEYPDTLGRDYKLCVKCDYRRATIGEYVICTHPDNRGIYTPWLNSKVRSQNQGS